MLKVMLFVFLVGPDGNMTLGDASNGHPFRSYFSVEDCEFEIYRRAALADRMMTVFRCVIHKEIQV